MLRGANEIPTWYGWGVITLPRGLWQSAGISTSHECYFGALPCPICHYIEVSMETSRRGDRTPPSQPPQPKVRVRRHPSPIAWASESCPGPLRHLQLEHRRATGPQKQATPARPAPSGHPFNNRIGPGWLSLDTTTSHELAQTLSRDVSSSPFHISVFEPKRVVPCDPIQDPNPPHAHAPIVRSFQS